MKIYNVFVFFFLAYICIPIFSYFGLSVNTSNMINERRILSDLPTLPKSWISTKEWPDKFDKYVQDNIPLRGGLVMINNTLLYSIGTSPNKNLVTGKNGWIFNNYDEAVAQYRGIKRMNSNLLNRNTSILRQNYSNLKRKGINFYFYVAPNKHTIYPEKLPSYCTVINEEDNFDLMKKHVTKNNLFPFIDIRGSLKRGKEYYPEYLYYKTDTHWNFTGSYIAYKSIMEVIKKDFHNLKIISDDELVLNTYDKYFGLLERMGTLPIFSDVGVELNFNSSSEFSIESNKDRLHLSNGRKKTVIRNLTNSNLPVLLLVGDSFNGFLFSYFSNSFSTVIVTYHNNGDWDTSLIEKYNPDIVVYEVLERFLGKSFNSTKFGVSYN